jgi:hypothetical protein
MSSTCVSYAYEFSVSCLVSSVTIVDSVSVKASDSKLRGGGVDAGASAMVRSASERPEEFRKSGGAGLEVGLMREGERGSWASLDRGMLFDDEAREVC